ncbi:putative C-5 cytosine-specific DNA methylase [Lyophyllum shimeji]|uniref:C-5 cytosine-specific DNA methylase n=1 Tax=Lyophyllum shimeji TaxID=47721 RepID=A0A9P3PUW3_LYOSH|nr:putative C-5 cytosine-specific DNA methylase [Lyophyllum shimeji]
MAKEKPSKLRAKGQKSLLAFFGGAKDNAHVADASNGASQPEDENIEEAKQSDADVEMDDGTVADKKGTKSSAPDASDLPPIHDIPSIFSDLVSRIPEIKNVAERVAGRKVRVATMCSGTESPLLALELIQKSIHEQHGIHLDIEHVFSCEIEPFKQAYIERNFHPPILFRDVCELGEDEAHTAYGALAPVPGDVDMLIAGTSCVDYSNLNTQKQDIDANGESGRTFRGMMKWVCKHRPPIVILENVCSAPWDKVKRHFEAEGYSATWQRVDTKHYYIPHTRTRVYLVAVDQKESEIPEEWSEWVKSKLRRPASSTLDAFLLPSDDPRIHQARQKLVRESYNALDRRTGRTDWGRCESRHQRARLEESLGSKRPLTGWEEGGFCKLPDFAWNDWGVGQVERVWDLMDISLLRSAVKGIDPCYKTQVWNLSQNVDRTIGSNKVGICPCLTPSMIPYITNRGGPMVGLEALSMQGLPVDKLLLTRETEDQLADLAGNAMSTTVVGACILAALVLGQELLKVGDDAQTYETKAGKIEAAGRAMNVDAAADETTVSSVVGDDELVYRVLDLSVTNTSSLPQLLADADRSARLCSCEGRLDMTTRELFRCADCGTTSCKKCGGRPEHNPVAIDLIANPRMPPSDFAQELKATLPMCITLSSVNQEFLDGLKKDAGATIPEKLWSAWSEAVLRASKSELRFVETKRQEIWSVVYRSPAALLELLLHPQQPEWRLYAVPKESEPANAEIRRVLELPIGRLTPTAGLLLGQWEFALPSVTTVALTIEGAGETVPSWEARLGLTSDKHRNKLVHSALEITVPAEELKHFDRDISGTYDLLDKCGTANGALHKKRATEAEAGLPPLFMLLDPHRTDDTQDSFVFSISKRRYEYGESRPIICRLDPQWRQSSKEGEQLVDCHLPSKWVGTASMRLQAINTDATFGTPAEALDVPVSKDACCDAHALLVCKVPLQGQAGPEWPRKEWKEVDKIHERSTFKSLAWLLERVRHVDEQFADWQEITAPEDFTNCERCAPTQPKLEWAQVAKKMVAIEDPIQAGEYERRLKRRPSPFVTQLRLDENEVGTVRVGVNIPSLVHRALARLPSANRTEPAVLSWRIDTNFTPWVALDVPPFRLLSNKSDKEHRQPPSFKLDLRPEQLRSLGWMLRQESRKTEPFVEEEISEAILNSLGWRAEGRAQRPVHVRGGVLADQVGYGKTAITLGLIDCASKNVDKEFEDMGDIPGKIPVKGTLVIVPPHLTKQWNSEVKKFTGKRFRVEVISTVANLNSLTIEAIQEADIIIVASNLFGSRVYLENLEFLAGTGALPQRDGRHFNAHLDKALESLKDLTEILKTRGSAAVTQKIKELEEEEKAAKAAAAALVQSKRLKGKSYREAADKAEAKPVVTDGVRKSKETSTKSSPPHKTPSGLIVEVYIDSLPPGKSSNAASKSTASSVASSPPETEIESDAPRPARRAVAKKPMIQSDSQEDASEEEIPKKSRAASSKRRPTRKASKGSSDQSSDYEASDAEESESEADEESAVSSGDDDVASSKRKTSKAKAKPKVKPRTSLRPKAASKVDTSSSNDYTDGDSMDVDEDASKTKKGTKRKAADDTGRPAKKQKRSDNDPWKLESKAVKEDWTQMKAPPLEIFHFARKVVDEYTYLEGKVHSLVTRLTAERHWVLSGTPPVHDFGALKTIAAFLNLHLGIDDDLEGQSAEIKKRRREQTAVERFHSFREVHSLEWHAHRCELGQRFLDRFVRQNIAEIDEIPWTEKIEKIVLPAAERAIYLELEHHLRALDMTIKRGKKTESDRERRLAKSLGESKTAEEALLKRCSHFDVEMSNENAMKACDVIVAERQKQLDECKVDLFKAIQDGAKREKAIGFTGTESMFNEWVRVSRGDDGIDDREASTMIVELLDKAGVGMPKKVKSEERKLSEKVKAQAWEHREKTHEIRRLTKELVGRVRSLRYFTVVRDLQKQREEPPEVSCPSCGREHLPMAEVAVLSSCGHMGCINCVKACAEKEECVYAASGACKSAARVLNVVKAETLGVDDEARDGRGKHFGMKLEKVVSLIKDVTERKERVLVFVQFPDLMKKVTEAFTYNKIAFLEIKGTAHQKSKSLEDFQNDSKERVLLLNVMDESASGANLTSANHAIFLSPLLAPSREIYKACETQAIGRLVRFGQTKHVYVWRFLTTNTIDEEIYEQRREVSQTVANPET